MTVSFSDASHQFVQALRSRSLKLNGPLNGDGRLHRCDAANKRGFHGKNDGVYVLHLDGWPAGAFVNYTDGQGWTKWKYRHDGHVPAEERAHLVRQSREARTEASRQRSREAQKGASLAQRTWTGAASVQDYDAESRRVPPYLKRKKVQPHGIRLFEQSLLVPLRDPDGQLVNLQYIDENGDKRFILGGRMAGCYFLIEQPERRPAPPNDGIARSRQRTLGDADRPICICEGFATGASIHEATGYQVYVAFNNGNLRAVARMAKDRHPNKRIVVCADDDWKSPGNPGVALANRAARDTGALVARPVFDLPRTEKQTDFNDMAAVAGGDDVKRAIDQAGEPTELQEPGGDDAEPEQNKKQQKQSLVLLSLAPTGLNGGLFRTRDRVAFADAVISGHRETWRIGSTSFRQWLMHQYYLKTGNAAGAEAIRSAIEMIEARAQFEEGVPVREVYIRVAGHAGKIYADLCDEQWRSVEISTSGWRIINNPPVRFRRAPGMLALPEPVRNGSIETLRSFVNVKSDDGSEITITDGDFVLLVSWLLAALRDTGPYPILKLWGEPGSAKSTTVEILRRLVDPHKVTRRRLPGNDRDLFIAANNAHVLSYDNLAGVPDWLSDALCCLATGGGYGTRTLFTNEDEQLFEAIRPVILNGVENFVTRHDLADRTMGIELQPIPDRGRRLEREFWAQFETECPRILGAVLDIVAYGLRQLPQTANESWPRMADFAHWITACEGAVWEPGTFRKAYAESRNKATLGAIEDDPVATALRALLNEQQPEWEGTTAELLDKLTAIVGDKQSRGKNWPSEARALTSRLQNAKASLRQVGIEIAPGSRTRRGRKLIITYTLGPPVRAGNDRHNPHHRHTTGDLTEVQGDDRREGPASADGLPTPDNRLSGSESGDGDGGVRRDGTFSDTEEVEFEDSAFIGDAPPRPGFNYRPATVEWIQKQAERPVPDDE